MIRYRVSSSQVELLLWVMKYRFVSSDVVAESIGKDRSTIYERLSVLVDRGYLVKLYDKTYRLRQRPVIYYLAPAGIRYLKKAGYERTQLHYKNKDFTDEQIDEQFLLGELARAVRKPYGKKFVTLPIY
jgi:biotin operon repressor